MNENLVDNKNYYLNNNDNYLSMNENNFLKYLDLLYKCNFDNDPLLNKISRKKQYNEYENEDIHLNNIENIKNENSFYSKDINCNSEYNQINKFNFFNLASKEIQYKNKKLCSVKNKLYN